MTMNANFFENGRVTGLESRYNFGIERQYTPYFLEYETPSGRGVQCEFSAFHHGIPELDRVKRKVGTILTVKRHPENPHYKEAIGIYEPCTQLIGWFGYPENAALSPYVDRGLTMSCWLNRSVRSACIDLEGPAISAFLFDWHNCP